jgi:rhodanese-related sulfurtransferase
MSVPGSAPVPVITPDLTMDQILNAMPGAKRALFRNFHIGGCSSCAFSPQETLAALSARNGLDPDIVLRALRAGHEEDAQILVEPAEARRWVEAGQALLIDARTREEHEAVHIAGDSFLTNELSRSLIDGPEDPGKWLVLYDHQGRQVLDAASYFIGHGLKRVRALRGGIDAWALELDPEMPRYCVE